jgi:outer membrane biosynthesis protein TonB
MTALAVSFREHNLPWAPTPDDEARFRRILGRVLGLCLLLALVVPWLPHPEQPHEVAQPLPAPMAKLLLEHEPPPPPPVLKPVPEQPTPAKDENPPEKQRVVPKPQPQPKPKAAQVPEARQPKPGLPPGEALDLARRKASGVGLLAMKDELQEMHSAPVAVQINTNIKPGPGVGTSTGPGVGAGNEPGIPVRNLITSNATNGSGGINTAGYSRNTGGGGLAGRGTTLIEGVAGGGGGGGPGGGGRPGAHGNGTGGSGGVGGAVRSAGSGKGSRSLEDLRIVFDRNKGAIYAIYNRALREDPTLQGRVVFSLKIAPSGEVTECHVVSSELHSPELENKLVARVKLFDFGAKDVNPMQTTFPLDFLPGG